MNNSNMDSDTNVEKPEVNHKYRYAVSTYMCY